MAFDRDEFWQAMERSAARVRGLPAWTSAGIVLSHNFEGGQAKEQAPQGGVMAKRRINLKDVYEEIGDYRIWLHRQLRDARDDELAVEHARGELAALDWVTSRLSRIGETKGE
jgi:hypothetical protein